MSTTGYWAAEVTAGPSIFDHAAFGRAVREVRQRRGLTLREVAAALGVSFNTLSRLERGRDTRVSVAALVGWWSNLLLDDYFITSSNRSDAQ